MAADAQRKAADELRAFLLAAVAQELGSSARELDSRTRFRDCGLTSRGALSVLSQLGERLGRELPVTLLWEQPTVDDVVEWLTTASNASHTVALTRPAGRAGGDDAIAVIGLACRFPGGVCDARSYWELLVDGRDAVTPAPASRFPGMRGLRGGFLEQVEEFDASFFGIAPRHAQQMDPQQRLMLELAWEGLEDAAIVPSTLRGQGVGVFIGAMASDYARLIPEPSLEQSSATGQDTSIIAARISYFLGLRGPSLVVNTACSSGLMGIHLACQSLASGESSLALAGGINLLLSPYTMRSMREFGAMSRKGACSAFDRAADGYVRSEGAGLVVLKPLRQALLDGDKVYAVVQGSAANNDGPSNGLTAPSPQAQSQVIRAALARAGLEPAEVGYVETHGPGTELGDPIEARGLTDVFATGRDEARPLLIGSVKTNVGHLEAAAGVAGFIKAVLAVHHAAVPKNLHFAEPNPHIDFRAQRLQVPTELSDFPVYGERRVAGVSSFGFGGTNVHAIIASPEARTKLALPIVAASAQALRREVAELQLAVSDCVGRPWKLATLAQLAQHAAAVSGDGELRRAIAAWDAPDMMEALSAELRRSSARKVGQPPPRIAFVYGGQGSAWTRMGRDLLRTSRSFRRAVEACDVASRAVCHVSPLSLLLSEGRPLAIPEVQILIFTMHLALTRTWEAWGVRPALVIGQSLGEVSAACVAGVLDLQQAIRVVYVRAKYVEAYAAGKGRMAVVQCAAHELDALCPAHAVTTAVLNGPEQTVIAGPNEAMARAQAALTQRGIEVRPVDVNYASHCPQMDPVAARLRVELADLDPRTAGIAFHSTVTRAPLEGRECTGDYWARNIREPVHLFETVHAACQQHPSVFIEISPHPLLQRTLQTAIDAAGQGMALPSGQRDQAFRASLLDSALRLHEVGVDLDWSAINAVGESEPAAPAAVAISARSEKAVRRLAASYADVLDRDDAPAPLALSALSLLGRQRFDHAAVAVGRTAPELASALRAIAAGAPVRVQRRLGPDRPRVAFMFSGQGDAYAGLGDELYAWSRAFQSAFDQCDATVQRLLGRSLRGAPPDNERARATDAQLRLFALQCGLVALWRDLGVQPDLLCGHSLGEYAAACTAGVLEPEGAIQLLVERDRLAQTLPAGAMATVPLPLSSVAAAIGSSASVGVAAINGPEHILVSGERAAVRALGEELQSAHDTRVWPVSVSAPFHSPLMRSVRDELERFASSLRFRPPALPLVSNMTGALERDATMAHAAYWAEHMCAPVQLLSAVRALEQAGVDVLLEIGPKATLISMAAACSSEADRWTRVASLQKGRSEPEKITEAAAQLQLAQVEINVHALTLGAPRSAARAPSYPFERRHFSLAQAPRASSQLDEQAQAARCCRVRYPPISAALTPEAEPRAVLVYGCAVYGCAPERSQAFVVELQRRRIPCRAVGSLAALRAALADHSGTAIAQRPVVLYVGDGPRSADAPAHARGVEACHDALQVVCALAAEGGQRRLFFVTHAAQSVAGYASSGSDAALWGLGRTLALEYPGLWGGLVDIGDEADIPSAIDVVLSADAEDQVIVRAGRPRVMRLEPYQPRPRELRLRADAVYLISGGLGAVGLAIAEALTSAGARRLALVGRRALTGYDGRARQQQELALERLGAAGASVTLHALDIADREAVAALLADLEPPIAGVIHAAGALDLAPADATTLAMFEHAARAKVQGGWVLHELTCGLDLELFALVSSAASLLGGRNEAAYAAACHALDALAHHRRRLGLPAVSLNFTPLRQQDGFGMAAGPLREEFARIGMTPTAPERACRALLLALGADEPQILVGDVDWPRFAEIYQAHGRGQQLGGLGATGPAREACERDVVLMMQLTAATPERVHALTHELIARELAAILGFEDASSISDEVTFADLGMDSIAAVKLRERLTRALGVAIDNGAVLRARSMPKLVEVVTSLLPQAIAAAEVGVQGTADEGERLVWL